MELKTQLLMLLLFLGISSFAQVYSDKIVGEKMKPFVIVLKIINTPMLCRFGEKK